MVLIQRNGVVRSDGDVVAVDERRPGDDLLVALVCRLDEDGESNLLAAVGGVGVELVVVDPDLVVRVAGGDGDLDVGGQKVRVGDVEGVDGGVLEDESRLLGLQDCPNQEYDDKDD